jgi:hypothetical protein
MPLHFYHASFVDFLKTASTSFKLLFPNILMKIYLVSPRTYCELSVM